MKVAVLDLGTNVFNMLLASFSEEGCSYLKEYKCAAKLGAGGLAGGNISEVAFETATLAMEKILKEIDMSGGADKIVPYAKMWVSLEIVVQTKSVRKKKTNIKNLIFTVFA